MKVPALSHPFFLTWLAASNTFFFVAFLKKDEDQQPFLRWRHHSSGLILRSKTEALAYFSCDFPMSFSASLWCEMMWTSHCFSMFLFPMFLPNVHQCHTDLFPCSNLSFSPPKYIYIFKYIYLSLSHYTYDIPRIWICFFDGLTSRRH